MIRKIVFSVAIMALLPFCARAAQPNVIIILSDDAGYVDFGVTGGTLVPTPHIDRLANEGIFCSQGYVTASTCTPSRMGLMSGQYQQRFGAECNVPTIPTPGYTKDDLGLDTAQRTLGDVMKSQGYRTMAVGKWHLGELPKYHPNRRGFDEFYGFLGGSRTYWPSKKPGHGQAIRRNEQAVDEMSEITYLTDDFTDAAMDFIERYQERPFFLYLAYNAVHGPFHAKEEDLEQCPKIEPKNRWMVSAMTKSMDDNIGRILAQLDGLGLTENTLIVFLNDNGGTQGAVHSNGSLRDFKGTYWEGGIRVPYIVSWPAQLPKGKRFDHTVSSLDLLPTCLVAGGGAVDPAWKMDGVNLLPYLKGQEKNAPHETMFWRFWRVGVAREGTWKLLRVAENPLKQERELLAPLMLINLEDDPGETTNLAEKFPEKTQALLRKMEAWEKPLAKPRWYDGSNWKHWQEEQLKNHKMTP
jgi:arylsulfatase A-like enzyme